jgi:hypothetical protein
LTQDIFTRASYIVVKCDFVYLFCAQAIFYKLTYNLTLPLEEVPNTCSSSAAKPLLNKMRFSRAIILLALAMVALPMLVAGEFLARKQRQQQTNQVPLIS